MLVACCFLLDAPILGFNLDVYTPWLNLFLFAIFRLKLDLDLDLGTEHRLLQRLANGVVAHTSRFWAANGRHSPHK